MHVVTSGHVRSRDKNGGDSTQLAISENLMLHAHFVAVCFIERHVLLINLYIAGIGIVDHFALVSWRSGWHVGFDQRGQSTSGPVSTEMGDRVGFNSRCQTSISVCNQPATQGQLSLPSLRGR